jgi:hypothetical protein
MTCASSACTTGAFITAAIMLNIGKSYLLLAPLFMATIILGWSASCAMAGSFLPGSSFLSWPRLRRMTLGRCLSSRIILSAGLRFQAPVTRTLWWLIFLELTEWNLSWCRFAPLPTPQTLLSSTFYLSHPRVLPIINHLLFLMISLSWLIYDPGPGLKFSGLLLNRSPLLKCCACLLSFLTKGS